MYIIYNITFLVLSKSTNCLIKNLYKGESLPHLRNLDESCQNFLPTVAVSRILGHADLKTTMRYAHPEDCLKEAVETLSRRFSDSVTDRFTDKHQFEN